MKAVLLLACFIALAFAYTCDPNTCKLPTCQCPTGVSPGGFSNADSPQFVTLSFDDSINADSQLLVQPLLDALRAVTKDAAGCTPKTTFYFLTDFSDYHTVTKLFAKEPIEIACHTMTHSTGNNSTLDTFTREITGCRDFTEKLALISKTNQNVGFRFPELAYNNEGYTALVNAGALYDTSLIEYWGSGEAPFQSSQGQMFFPFTLDNGSPLNADTGPALSKFPGLWEIPMHDMMGRDGTPLFSMDPDGANDAELLQLLTDNFNDHYLGNRAPFGVYTHAPWLNATGLPVNHTKVLIEFFQSIATKPGVLFVTPKQIIEWSQNPTNLATTITRFQCTTPVPVKTTEICNGIDDNQNGQIDEGTTNTCSYPEGTFVTCGLCPTTYPNPTTLNFVTNPPCNTPGLCKIGVSGNAGETCVNCPGDCGVCVGVNITTSPTTSASTTSSSTVATTSSTSSSTTDQTTAATTDDTKTKTNQSTETTNKPTTTPTPPITKPNNNNNRANAGGILGVSAVLILALISLML